MMRLLRATPRLVLVVALALLSVPAAIVATFVGRGSIEHLLLVTAPALLVGPVVLVAGAALWVLGFRVDDARLSRRLRWLAAGLVGLALFALVLAPSYVPGILLHFADVGRARQYVNDLVPRLEAWKEERGRYPAEIEPVLPAQRPVPRLLEGRVFYHRIGAGYEFVFPNPATFDGGYAFFSPDTVSRGRWESY